MACVHTVRCVCRAGIKESDTGLAHPGLWDLAADKQMMSEEQPLQVQNALFVLCARCL